MFKLVSFIFVIVALIFVINAEQIAYTNCDSSSPVTFTSVDVSPFPLVAGQDILIKASGSTTETLTAGTVTITASAFGITVLKENKDLCQFASCPVNAGPASIAATQAIPKSVPALKDIEIKVEAVDQSNNEILCISFKADIVKSSETIILS